MLTLYKSFLLSMLLIVCSINSAVAQWVQTGAISISGGFGLTTVTALAVTYSASGDTNLFVAANQSGNNAIFESTDNGISWSQKYYFGATSPGYVNAFVHSDTNIFAVTTNGIYLSTNNFASWSVPDSGLLTRNITSLAFSGTNMFAGTSSITEIIATPPYVVVLPGGVLLSTDKGATWIVVDSGLTDTASTQVSALASIGNTIVAGTSDNSGIFRSTNNGTSWTPANNGFLKESYDSTLYGLENAFAVMGANLFVATEQGVFRSTDNGASWNPSNTGIPLNEFSEYPSVSSLASAGTNLFAGMGNQSAGGVYQSTNSGASWTWTDSGKVGIVTSLVVSGNYIYAVTGSGVWRRALSDMGVTGIAQVHAGTIKTFSLSQNYPNPFNPTTTISFTLPSQSSVSLKVFDIIGREVATLVSGEMPAGTYARQWDATKVSSGVYFYRLQAGNLTETKKLVLLK